MDTPLLHYLAPLWLLFEIGQLVIAERHLGIKQIESGIDPRERGPGEFISFLWSLLIVSYWVWMILALIPKTGRTAAACMLIVSLAGYSFRRNASFRWILVLLTFEGAIRIGLLVFIIGSAWRSL